MSDEAFTEQVSELVAKIKSISHPEAAEQKP
jgi:hypothetical protein